MAGRPGLMCGARGAWVEVEGSVSTYCTSGGCTCTENVVDYLAGQLKRAGFPGTSKEADIPQHPSGRIDGAQHERGDIYIPGFDGSVLGS